MAIKIIKKRHAPEVRTPAPLVEEPASPEPTAGTASKGATNTPAPTVCSFCGHVYYFPCHGENDNCMNAQWVKEKGGKTLGKAG